MSDGARGDGDEDDLDEIVDKKEQGRAKQAVRIDGRQHQWDGKLP